MNLTRLALLPIACILILGVIQSSLAAERRYELTIAQQEMNPGGKPVESITVNGGIPAPTLRFREGDDAVLVVHNKLSAPSSIHWHGLLVPPEMDGVPGISFPPIPPGGTYTYRFPIRQTGTYWYHSHSALQEQRGLYGSIVVTPKAVDHGEDRDHVVVLSDWTERSPDSVMRLLRRGSEFMGVQKRTSQSLLGAVKTNKFAEFWKREAMRMPPMDLADVAYDAFLTNGRQEETLAAKPGETIRLRIIDGSATTFFHMRWAGGPVTIVAADGQPVEPVKYDKPLLIGVAETYDVLVRVPGPGLWEFRSTAHDGSGHTSLWIGSGERRPAPDMAMPFLYDTMDMFGFPEIFALTPGGSMGMPDRDVEAGKFDQPGMNMDMGAMKRDRMDDGGSTAGRVWHGERMEGMAMDHAMPMDHGSHGSMSGGGATDNPPAWYDFLLREDLAQYPRLADDGMMSMERPWNPYPMLRAVKDTRLAANAPRRIFRLTLDGDMGEYVWSINNQPLSPNDNLHIRKGEVVRFVMINRTMMHHPMHLHGHFFRVLNGQGARSPLKHTVNVPPMTTTVIEFEANEFGDWFFHCHLLYHLDSGMARVVKYDGYEPDAATVAAKDEVLYHKPLKLYGMVDLLSNETQGTIYLRDLLNSYAFSWEAGWDGVEHVEWEADLVYRRYINRFTSVFAGVYGEGAYQGNREWQVESERLIAGVNYLLPGNFWSTAWVDSDGEARVSLERELMLTPRLGIFGEVEYDTRENWSYQAGTSYLLTPNLSLTGLWDSKYGVGAGVTLSF
ncbi:multicopper oxidase domain-containing protein [Haloferula sargassicola]|uniref:Cell division protein FtsP n=1 Tax=Haloferula sargassicola TaxID=490096 RepID=A0ABP9UTA7_9BACT